ncbi:MAG: HAMP domain-containing protein [Verrucomicrobia bacterium]|nr:HAMP domain-containing protein [Verrucomicrobiota bacterium]
MFRRSLTAKMLLAVGVTVAAVIAIYTYFVFRIQNAWWHERTQAQNHINASMVHEYLEGVMLSDRHREVQHFLQQLQTSQEIWQGRIIKPTGQIVFSTRTQEVGRVMLHVPPALFKDGHVIQDTRAEDGQRLAVVMKPIPKRERCQQCHAADPPLVGALILERSMTPAEASIATNRNILIAYGALIFVLVGVVLWLLIVRLVTQPVNNVLQQMRRVQRGDLAAHAATDRADEIGELEQDFNAMVRSLDDAKRELHRSHEKQIQQAGKLASIGELASGIAHEIRNPLAGIGAAVEVLTESGAGNGQDAEVVAEIRRQIARLNGTLCDLLDFARPREPEITPCGIHELIRPMLALVRPDAQKFHVQIVEELPPDLPLVCVDIKLVQQAILNILLNAVQAMPDGGTLTVSARPIAKVLMEDHECAVQISIRDTGPGIPPEHREKIFSPFFTTKHRGTGLGLSITRTIVEKHSGTLTVESAAGRGTAMIMEFAACTQTTPSHCSRCALRQMPGAPFPKETSDNGKTQSAGR